MGGRIRRAYKARMRRWKESWDAPDADPARVRRAAALDMLLFDHGLIRMAWRNFHVVHDGVWRSAQPDPGFLRRLKARGLRTVVNLRGETLYGSYRLEREACAELGIALIDVKGESRRLPDRAQMLGIETIFDRAERPLLLHCKSGADRAGFFSALYLLMKTDVPVAEAKKQLSGRYLHFRNSGTGVLDHMLDAYEAAARARGVGFREWIRTDYDPGALMAGHESGAAGNFLVDRVLGRE